MSTWLTALPAWPAPGPPRCVIDRQNASSAGRAIATCASSPPTNAVSWPLRAPSEPPETGASTAPAPRSASAAATRRDVSGAIVEQSSTTAPRSMPSAMPSAPSTMASTSGESETHRHTSSAPCAPPRAASRRGSRRARPGPPRARACGCAPSARARRRAGGPPSPHPSCRDRSMQSSWPAG